MALYLTESDVESLLTMRDAVIILESAFKDRAEGDAFNIPRRRLPTSSGAYNFMAATWESQGLAGHKSYVVGKAGVQFHVMLYDTSENRLMAVIEANKLGQIRTGAASGLATRYMARRDLDEITVGIIGSGYQAETQLEAIASKPGYPDIRKVRVYSRNAKNRERFASKMSKKLDLDVRPVKSAKKAAKSDVVCTITSSAEPVLKGKWLRPGTHINAAGNNSWMKRELDTRAVAFADVVAVDDVEQAKIECGELMRAAETGHFSWDSVVPLHQIVSDQHDVRWSEDEITLFESQGIALEDIAVAQRVVSLARERGVGFELPG